MLAGLEFEYHLTTPQAMLQPDHAPVVRAQVLAPVNERLREQS